MALLTGVVVLDLGQVLAGPLVGSLLGDFGADVIKVDRPKTIDHGIRLGGRQNAAVSAIGRNKRSVILDFDKAAGKEALWRLIDRSSALIENFRPGVLEGKGFGDAALEEHNRDLVVLHISGYGQFGPKSKERAFGKAIEAWAGLASLTGYKDGAPLHPGFPLTDVSTAFVGAFAVTLVLAGRAMGNTQGFEVIDLALYDAPLRMLDGVIAYLSTTGMPLRRDGSRQPGGRTLSNIYRSRDGHWISIVASSFTVLRDLLACVKHEELIGEAVMGNADGAARNIEEIDYAVRVWIEARGVDDVVQELGAHGVAAVPVLGIEEVIREPQIQIRNGVEQFAMPEGGISLMPGVIPKVRENPGAISRLPPWPGQDTEEVLREIAGLSNQEIRELRRQEAI